MKKIPTVFVREYKNHRVVGIKPEFTSEECKEAFLHGDATLKVDGSCCAFCNGNFYKRYDAKKGKTPPKGAIPCCEPDPVTGHHPHWVPVDSESKDDKWFTKAAKGPYLFPACGLEPERWTTMEAIGPHFQGNPYGLEEDKLVTHGITKLEVERTMEGVREYLANNAIEGIVFWVEGKPVCKIKRTDFGLEWPVANARYY